LIPFGDLPIVNISADWASSPKADDARAAMYVAVNFAAGTWALQSERILLDPRFDLWRDCRATSVG
jgi:hypothetical protein